MGMIISMPRVDPAMEKGIILKIMKKVGDKVSKNETILKVMTEKATFEINSPYEGYVTKIFHNEGEELNVGEPILEISPTLEVKEEIQEVLATPAARRLAREYGIDLSKIKGSGPHGRITQEDVLQFLSQKGLEKKEESIPLSPIRRIIAERVEKSHKEIPQLTVHISVKVDKLLKHRAQRNFSFDSYFIFASSRVLKDFPLLNSEYKDGMINLKNDINIAFALAIENELYMPVVKNADKKSLEEIDKEHSTLIEKAKKGNLSLEDLQGYTFSITNLGAYEVIHFNPLIYPPNVAILGIGNIEYKIYSENDSLYIKPSIVLSLTFDHRVIDGMYAARFLKKIKDMIESGSFE